MRFINVFALTLLSLAPSIHSLPAPVAPRTLREVYIRQNNGGFNGPQTVHTVNTANTGAGSITTSCDITLTPIQNSDGQNYVQEVQNCQISVNGQDVSSSNNNGGNSGSSSSSGSSSDSSSSSSTTTSGDTSTSSSTSSSSNNGSSNSSTSTTGSNSGGALSVQGVVATEGILSAAPSATDAADAVSTTGSSSSAGSGSGAAVVADGFTSVTGTDTPSPTGALGSAVSALSSATAADDTAPSTSSAAAFQIPGRSLQVLPIGLGIFAGISVIALIVVGLVTYERTKYRRAFRHRRLAEQGANMGYGGAAMSQA